MVKKIIILFTFFLITTSCTSSLYKNTFVISGTYLTVISPYQEAAQIVFGEFKRLDKVFNYYSPDSEIAKLNNTFDKEVQVSSELIEVLQLSREIYNLSQGAFDISCGRLYEFWKSFMKGKKISEFPVAEQIKALKDKSGMQYIEVNAQKNTVTIKKEGLKIDLSAIAKGYMVDKSAQKLIQAGIDSAIINAGGDLYCLGRHRDKTWKSGIKDPSGLKEIIETVDLADEAIATSGSYEQFFNFKGRRYSHLIDPRQGYPVENDILSVSVVSKNCTTADSLATAFFIMGLEGVKSFLSNNPSTLKIFVVTLQDGKENIHIFK
ncbi:MAG: FAD:protein FMN transferase [Candidatus Omnitrophica bacterium]|jgi:thiamine biosynthesis lipoprotein|nr:FAD:protein FMN transferase [Candidatus Omnitrophota bacterium]